MATRLDAINFNIKHKDKLLLNNASLSLKKGEITALVGNSGSGKSIFSSAIMGLCANNLSVSGELLIDNAKPVSQIKYFCSIMQNPRTAFNPLFSIRNCIVETMKARAVYNKYSNDLIVSELLKLGLEKSTLDLYPHQLSGGMLQRVMIAIALLSKADFLIADEPTSDLDLLSQKAVLDILENIKESLGILLITHDFGVVARLAEGVLVMSEGEIVENKKVRDIFENPSSKTAKELISAHLKLYGDDFVRAN